MKKSILFATLLALPQVVYAQLIDVSGFVQEAQMSEEYLNNLESCTPYEETKSAKMMGMQINTTYKVIGKEGNKCKTVNDSDSGMMGGVSSSQTCLFSDENLKTYVKAMRKMLNRKEYTLESMTDMMNDEDYMLAMGLTMDEDICKTHRDAIDMTKELRAALSDCSPYSKAEQMGATELMREVKGKEGTSCNYVLQMTIKKPDLSNVSGELVESLKPLMENMEEQWYRFTCAFTDEQVKEYTSILEKQIIPASDSMDDMLDDMNNPQGFDPNAEMNFVEANCSANSSMDERMKELEEKLQQSSEESDELEQRAQKAIDDAKKQEEAALQDLKRAKEERKAANEVSEHIYDETKAPEPVEDVVSKDVATEGVEKAE